MPSPSQEIIQLLAVFAQTFTVPTFTNALLLLYGTILAPGRRTVAALRAMGLADSKHFTNYHRVLNRAQWSPWVLSKLLLALIIRLFVPEGMPLVLAIDETLERRRGPKIKYKGWFRDPIRSTVKLPGHRPGLPKEPQLLGGGFFGLMIPNVAPYHFSSHCIPLSWPKNAIRSGINGSARIAQKDYSS